MQVACAGRNGCGGAFRELHSIRGSQAQHRVESNHDRRRQSMRIRKEERIVFVGGKRASFSRGAAYRNEAKARIAKKYPCTCSYDPPDYASGYPGYPEVCDRHQWPVEKWANLVNRLARFMRFCDKRERETRLVRYAAAQPPLNHGCHSHTKRA